MARKVIYFSDSSESQLKLYEHLAKMENPSEYIRNLIAADLNKTNPLTRSELEDVLKNYLFATPTPKSTESSSQEDVNSILDFGE